MTAMEFRAQMLFQSVKAAQVLCEGTCPEDTKIEPEQVRKNATTILTLLTEVENFLEKFQRNTCSGSENQYNRD